MGFPKATAKEELAQRAHCELKTEYCSSVYIKFSTLVKIQTLHTFMFDEWPLTSFLSSPSSLFITSIQNLTLDFGMT